MDKSQPIEKLNARQVRFVESYMVTANAYQAAIAAGYAETTALTRGAKMLDNVGIKHELERRNALRAEKAGIDAEWVLDNLVGIVRRSTQAEPVRDKDGNPTGEYKYDSAGANKALELIGKHLQMWKDKPQDAGDRFQLLLNIAPPPA